MDKAKYGVLAGGILGIIGCFLPLIGGISLMAAISLVPAQVLLVAAGYIIGTVLGVVGLIGKFNRVFAIICTAGFALSTIKTLDAIQGQIGGKLLFVGAILGLVCSVIMIIKPEE